MLRTNELGFQSGEQECRKRKIPISWKRERKVGEEYTMESLILAQDER